MPQKNGTGPQGNGPKTGRGMGKCTPQNAQNDTVQQANMQKSTQSSTQQAPQRPMRRGCGMGRRSNS